MDKVKIAYALADKIEQKILADINEALYPQRFIRNDYREGYITFLELADFGPVNREYYIVMTC